MVKLRGATMSILVLLAIVGCTSTTMEPSPTTPLFDVTPMEPPPTTPLPDITPVVTPTPSSTSGETPVAKVSSGIVEKLSIEDLAVGAQCILVGTVEGRQSHWNSQRTAIYTDVAVSVERGIKGCSEQSEVLVRVPGGIVGEMAMEASTAPTFENGEQVLLFLEREEDAFRILGGFQGKLTIQDDTVLGPDFSLSSFVEEIERILNRSGP